MFSTLTQKSSFELCSICQSLLMWNHHGGILTLDLIIMPILGSLALSQTTPGFYVSAVQVFWKHWEKEKLLVTSNFSFSRSVLYPFGEFSAIFIKLEIVVCKLFQFGRV